MLALKIFSGIAGAALIAASVIALPGFSPEVEARTPAPVVRGDRLDVRPVSQECSQQTWPYYEANCLRDRTRPNGQGRQVRIVSTDRVGQ